ncbi:DUF2019 domain-containing protein [Afipia massiliensis]|uniref:DUF2019 domain-containing protein n=1 Tax=Afipia massiliensis TaxID=211460 RepID=A0A4U6BWT5_9BRAD|nr:DUF2019 domain-containing protein [Afipia massiliensis]TKT73688.1 DUF2019 domain-containing protein [Afipia massiliensis]
MSRRIELETASVEDLVALFADIAVKQNAALENIRSSEYNRLYGEMEEVAAQLKSREGDQRRALLPLYTHPNPTVRFKAAIATLALAPREARDVLQLIKDRKEYPIAMNASQMLRAVDEGRYIPT